MDMMSHHPQLVCPINKDILFTWSQHQHRRQETNIWHYYDLNHRSHSSFVLATSFLAKGSISVLFSTFHSQFSCNSFNLEQSSSLLNFHDLDTSENYRPVVLYNVPQFELISYYLVLWLRLHILGRTITKVMLC